jgi:hypothetical protein
MLMLNLGFCYQLVISVFEQHNSFLTHFQAAPGLKTAISGTNSWPLQVTNTEIGLTITNFITSSPFVTQLPTILCAALDCVLERYVWGIQSSHRKNLTKANFIHHVL